MSRNWVPCDDAGADAVERRGAQELQRRIGRPPQKRDEALRIAGVGIGLRMKGREDERHAAELVPGRVGVAHARGEIVEALPPEHEPRVNRKSDVHGRVGHPPHDGREGRLQGVAALLEQHGLAHPSVLRGALRPGAEAVGLDDLGLIAPMQPNRFARPALSRVLQHRSPVYASSRRKPCAKRIARATEKAATDPASSILAA